LKNINTRKRYAGLDEAGNGQRKEDFFTGDNDQELIN